MEEAREYLKTKILCQPINNYYKLRLLRFSGFYLFPYSDIISNSYVIGQILENGMADLQISYFYFFKQYFESILELGQLGI